MAQILCGWARMDWIAKVRMNRMFGFDVEIEEEEDGRWIADIPAIPGVLVYGETPEEARAKAAKLTLLVLLDRLRE